MTRERGDGDGEESGRRIGGSVGRRRDRAGTAEESGRWVGERKRVADQVRTRFNHDFPLLNSES
jgi:hypothetical protein